jgi:hypothetical protein
LPKWTDLWPVFFYSDSLARADESWMTQRLLCSWELFCYAHFIIQWYGSTKYSFWEFRWDLKYMLAYKSP